MYQPFYAVKRGITAFLCPFERYGSRKYALFRRTKRMYTCTKPSSVAIILGTGIPEVFWIQIYNDNKFQSGKIHKSPFDMNSILNVDSFWFMRITINHLIWIFYIQNWINRNMYKASYMTSNQRPETKCDAEKHSKEINLFSDIYICLVFVYLYCADFSLWMFKLVLNSLFFFFSFPCTKLYTDTI